MFNVSNRALGAMLVTNFNKKLWHIPKKGIDLFYSLVGATYLFQKKIKYKTQNYFLKLVANHAKKQHKVALDSWGSNPAYYPERYYTRPFYIRFIEKLAGITYVTDSKPPFTVVPYKKAL